MAGASCTAPDPVLFPATWSGNANDYDCTEDETTHFNIHTFSYSCKPTNCAVKYASNEYTFDTVCRVCVACTDAQGECESYDIDSNTAGLSDCLDDGSCETVDCGPHGTPTGDFSCQCDVGYKTDVNSELYCSVFSNATTVADNTESGASVAAQQSAALGIAIALGVLVVIAAVITAVVVARKRSVGRLRATEQAVEHLMHTVRRKSNKVTRLQDESLHASTRTILHWIDWREQDARP